MAVENDSVAGDSGSGKSARAGAEGTVERRGLNAPVGGQLGAAVRLIAIGLLVALLIGLLVLMLIPIDAIE